MNIGFDFDRVLVDYPPFIPPRVIDWFYRNHNRDKLSYSIPRSPFTKLIRRLTHFSFLRPNIKENVCFVQRFSNYYYPHYLYLISSRYQFLEKITLKLLQKYNLTAPFQAICLNIEDEQPHLFKAKIIKKIKIDLYVDDDLELLQYLHQTCPNTKLFWYNPGKEIANHDGVIMIKKLSEIEKYLK